MSNAARINAMMAITVDESTDLSYRDQLFYRKHVVPAIAMMEVLSDLRAQEDPAYAEYLRSSRARRR